MKVGQDLFYTYLDLYLKITYKVQYDSLSLNMVEDHSTLCLKHRDVAAYVKMIVILGV